MLFSAYYHIDIILSLQSQTLIETHQAVACIIARYVHIFDTNRTILRNI